MFLLQHFALSFNCEFKQHTFCLVGAASEAEELLGGTEVKELGERIWEWKMALKSCLAHEAAVGLCFVLVFLSSSGSENKGSMAEQTATGVFFLLGTKSVS